MNTPRMSGLSRLNLAALALGLAFLYRLELGKASR